jgi:hypothetical protein
MKYEKSKAQQLRKDDGYKKGAKRQAAKMSRRHGARQVLEWVGEKCGTRFDEVPPADVPPGEGYKPGDREQCVCGTQGCWAVVKVKSDL